MDEEVTKQLCLRNAMLDELKEHLEKAQHRMKKFVDQHRQEVSFSIGVLVLLKLCPY